jgi:NAD(P)-dependent dehydrogenase (short-subunit alcohol dehydrogenase family)
LTAATSLWKIPAVLLRAVFGNFSVERQLIRSYFDLLSTSQQDLTGGIMSAAPNVSGAQREPDLSGQTVVVIGGSAGIGLETARRARAEGAAVILTGRNPERLDRAAAELGALNSAAFDALNSAALLRFFQDLPERIDHVMVTAGGPYYARLSDLDRERAHRDFDEHLWLPIAIAQHAVGRVRPGGTLLFMGGTSGRSRGPGMSLMAASTAALPALIANLALEIAPIRVNLIAAGFVDTPLSASLLGNDLDQRRNQLRAMLPIGRVVGPADVAALAVHIMTNTTLTGATYDIDGGQQLVSGS